MFPAEGESCLHWPRPGATPRPAHSPAEDCLRVLRDLYYRYRAWRVVQNRGGCAKERSEDRRVLEQIIIPFVLSRFEPRTVLDIGREAYEAFYNGFFTGRRLWTIDRDSSSIAFGAANHIVGDIVNLRDYFAERYFDFVLMNGVFGWGLNEGPAVEQAFAAIYAILRPGGIFVLGWNDTPSLTPLPLNQVQALKDFAPCFVEPLSGTSFKCPTYAHTFRFYTRRP